MQRRKLGRTGLEISILGFGAGAVGGLMTKGAAADQERAIARAVDQGINYIDTASIYGNGESERNLGRVLKALKPNIVLGTKVRLKAADRKRVATFVASRPDFGVLLGFSARKVVGATGFEPAASRSRTEFHAYESGRNS